MTWLRWALLGLFLGAVVLALTACESNPIVIKHVHVLTFEIPKIPSKPGEAD